MLSATTVFAGVRFLIAPAIFFGDKKAHNWRDETRIYLNT